MRAPTLSARRRDSSGPARTGGSRVDQFRRDLRFGVRHLARRPGLTAAAVLTLALGIGANTAVYSVVSGVLMEPLPYPQPDRLVRVFDDHTRFPRFPLSPANFLDYRDRDLPFQDFALFMRADLQLAEGERPERLTAMRVSAGFFRVLGISPLLGRGFTSDEELQGSHYVAVLSHRLWQQRFAADPDILGRTIELSGRPFTVIGVAQPGIQHPGGDFRSVPHGQPVDVWWPLVLGPGEQPRFSHYLNGIARLRDGVLLEQASAAAKAVASEVAEAHPHAIGPCTVELEPLRDDVVGQARPMLLVLLGAAGLILLIACVNVAGVMFARAAERRSEIAVRIALGAGSGHLLRQMLVEGALVALLGGAAGLALAVWALPQLLGMAPAGLPRLYAIGMDGRVLSFALAATAATALFAGLAPAFHARRFDVASTLRADSGGALRRAARSRRAFVVAQAALAVVLLVGAGLLLRTFVELRRVDPGFRPEGVLTASLSLPSARYPARQDRAAFHRELVDRLEALPSVRAAGVSYALPWTGYDESTGFEIEGWAPPPDLILTMRYHFVSRGFLQSIGVPLVAGRQLTRGDDAEAPAVVLINESMARHYWTEQADAGQPLGSRLRFYGRTWTVVGIVGDVKDGPAAARAEPAVFIPVLQWPMRSVAVALRTEGDPLRLAEPLRQTVAGLDPGLPIADVRTLADVAAANTADARFTVWLVGLFAAVALALAVVGLYGLMSYLVGQRTREIAVRMALGAGRSHVLRLVVGEGVVLAAVGLGLGLVASLAFARLMATLLYGVAPFDPATLVGVAAVLLLVAGAACYLPARRAAAVEPMRAMR